MSSEAAQAFYEENLTAQGWQRRDRNDFGGGFSRGTPNDIEVTYCSPNNDVSLNIRYIMRDDQTTDVRVWMNTDPTQSTCAEEARAGDFIRARRSLLPRLVPPVGAEQFPEGGGSHPGHIHSYARLVTNLDLNAVYSHYAGQLSRARWTLTGEGRSGPSAWSAWTFTDEGGAGWKVHVFILGRPWSESEYTLGINAEMDNANPRNIIGGWSHTEPRG